MFYLVLGKKACKTYHGSERGGISMDLTYGTGAIGGAQKGMWPMEVKRAVLRSMLPGESISDELATHLLEGAEATLLALTNRPVLPQYMCALQVRLAVIRYNRMGMEGESARKEGSVTIKAEGLPKDMMDEIRAWRIAVVPT